MPRLRAHRTYLTLCLLWVAAPWVAAQAPDPTTPSSQIAERLRPAGEEAAQPATDRLSRAEQPQLNLRLRGLVLGGADQGFALIGSQGSKLYILKLDRAALAHAPITLDIEGTRLVLEDFDTTSVTLRCSDTGQQLTIH